ncbi:hypothetical protein ASPSYDRAFT_1165358 [Aspergillus sydowii CBS 593.65]|uniref:Cyclase n=1 Tax=Aspergillus sydowii CBS 593.65 TaxID=1036612 RepID=A0A1L9T088_9EURO|nr:uncharacterized protein ASPSYDRAFT_1165358 [Aspergillus sydowii CBS 593.65]OJJ52884.1 hypothetical protein ASPSYDRAFT_1165358 [Aspergillus sydowii CBS 593.65]
MDFPGRKPLPALDDLPLRKGDPPFSAWGLWENTQLGSLNYLSDDVVKAAAREEIQTGARVGLNLPIDFINPSLLGRVPFSKHIHNKAPRVINDDIITFNTQCSSQWDSFRHFAYQNEAKFYNGQASQTLFTYANTTVNGLDAWAEKGIAGRGVFIDYFDWAQERGIQYNTLTNHPIPIEHVRQIIAEKGITIRQGDILFMRTGYVQAYAKLSQSDREELSKRRGSPGLGQGKETTEWLWKSQFAAVVADSVAFECSPPVDPEYHLHPILLAGWGTPIGELFDLEALSATCKKLNRWTFFLTSAPLNYTGAVASPPNAIAFF